MPQTTSSDDHRIAKLLARAGIASRREVERMIADGRVALDGKILDTPATILKSLDGVTVDGNPVAAPEPTRLFLYHKPTGLLVAERDPKGRPTIYDKLPRALPRVVPVGRLDLNTEGLLLLTTDGGLKRQLELPATGVERAYRARAYGQVHQSQLEALAEGVEIEGIRYGSIDANIERRTGTNVWIEMVLTEGKNREVRRVLEYLGLQVSRLIRTRYGPFVLGDLPPGGVGEVLDRDLSNFRKTLKNPPRHGASGRGVSQTPLDHAGRGQPDAGDHAKRGGGGIATAKTPASDQSRVRRPRVASGTAAPFGAARTRSGSPRPTSPGRPRGADSRPAGPGRRGPR